VLNGANEEAVNLFLEKKIPFTGIAKLVESALDAHEIGEAEEETILAADKWAREHVRSRSQGVTPGV
jgi:1-deoxy-D-xylulose-5-phosphate reductoisomerase